MNPGTGKYERLLERCAGLAPVPAAVVHPCEQSALEGALEAGAKGLITPILVGPADNQGHSEIITIEHQRNRRSSMRRTAMIQLRKRCSWCARAGQNC